MKRQALNLMSNSQYITSDQQLREDSPSMSHRLLADGTVSSPYSSRLASERKIGN